MVPGVEHRHDMTEQIIEESALPHTGYYQPSVVGDIAARLMTADAAAAYSVSLEALQSLVDTYELDVAVLRYNDHRYRTSTLFAHWPHKGGPDSDYDPMAVVPFEYNAVFAQMENQQDVVVLHSDRHESAYQDLLTGARGSAPTSIAAAPLRDDTELPMGVLCFVRRDERPWTTPELDTLCAVASLLASFNRRIIAENKLSELNRLDARTGLLNRGAFDGELTAMLSAEGGPRIDGVLALRLHGSGAVADILGDEAHEAFLKEAGATLRTHLPDGTPIARFADADFIVALRRRSATSTVEDAARALQASLLDAKDSEGMQFIVGADIGYALTAAGDTAGGIVGRARQALLSRTTADESSITGFTSRIEADAEQRLEIARHLRDAIDHDRLDMHYQPQVDLESGRIVGVEALVRWAHPTLGFLLPDSFVEIVESLGMADDLGRAVLRIACRDFAGWRAAGVSAPIRLRINISPSQLFNSEFADYVTATVAASGLTLGDIGMEITEGTALRDVVTTQTVLERLRKAGMSIAIDDFGTGFSSLFRLKHLHIDVVKIDQSFVRDIAEDTDDVRIVANIIALADSFGLGVIAEGVENVAAATCLSDLGCRTAQGYYFSRPLDADHMAELLRTAVLPVWRAATPG